MNHRTLSKTPIACCALGLGLLLASCSSSPTKTLSKEGESCASSDDCATGLACFSQICAKGPIVAPAGLDAGTTTPPPAGDGGDVTPPPSPLSKEFESCARHSDCIDPLFCVDQVCTHNPPAAAKPPGNNTSYGQRGETCTSSADCIAKLACIPEATGAGAIGLGRCDYDTFGITPTGKTCDAECVANTDCCELPLGLTGPTGQVLHSCADILAAASAQGGCSLTPNQTWCFYLQTYCNCQTANPWVCTKGRCSYTTACQASAGANMPDGCPSQSRAGFPLITMCTASKCALPTFTGCTADADCDLAQVVDDPIGDSCQIGECTCLSDTQACYRKCSDDLDCSALYTCDTIKHVCKLSGTCDNDAYCAKALHNVAAACAVAPGALVKTCQLPCSTDLDCDGTGATGSSFGGKVCSQGFCTDVGCRSNLDCSRQVVVSGSTTASIKMFCTTPTAATAAPSYQSAITN
jgi:hypothetical protein